MSTLGAIPPNQKDILSRRGGYSVKKNNGGHGNMGSPVGRAEKLVGGSAWDGTWIKKIRGDDFTGLGANSSGTSIFDPVLCELVYRWFCPSSGIILDPFAGGSVRGIVAAYLGYQYVGVDLSTRQIEANRIQARTILNDIMPTWTEGDSRNIDALANGKYDLIFSCPPYFDLEVYSNDEKDLSAMPWESFLIAYCEIISKACSMLNENRFACFVVGDIRDRNGYYRNFVGETIKAFQDAGAILYNEAILVTAIGSLPIRIGRQFSSYRKLGKTHQNVLVFYKGNIKQIAKDFPEIEVSEIDGMSIENDDAL